MPARMKRSKREWRRGGVFIGPGVFGRWGRKRAGIPEYLTITPTKNTPRKGGGIHFFGAEQLDTAGLAKLHALAPLSAVHAGMAPFLCIHGTKDDQVSYEQSTMMCDAMHKVGAGCELVTVEGGGHGMSSWKDPSM